MTTIDRVWCAECGYEEDRPDTIPQKCPDCGANTNNYYKEKIFG